MTTPENGFNGTTAADLENVRTNVEYSFAPMPVGDLSIQTNNKRLFKYNPQSDITGLELAHMLHLFVSAMAASKSFAIYDYWSFIEKHRLERHFQEQV